VSSVARKSQPPIAPLIWGPMVETGMQSKLVDFTRAFIQAAPTPIGTSGKRGNVERRSPHWWFANPDGATYLIRFSASAAGVAAQSAKKRTDAMLTILFMRRL
jgi:hypothetical protein